jgi:hypothetical protein
MVEGGEMCCPPFVKGRESARRYFGEGYFLHFVGEESKMEAREDGGCMEWPKPKEEKKWHRPTEPRPKREKKKGGGGVCVRPRRKVAQYDLDGNLIRLWRDKDEAAGTLGLNRDGISKCCYNGAKSAYGFVWRFVDGECPERIEAHGVVGNRAKRVVCKDGEGKVIAEYRSTVEAAKAVGISARMMRYYCTVSGKAHDGVKWEYVNS